MAERVEGWTNRFHRSLGDRDQRINVGRAQKLIHHRGQIESPASLPCGAIVGCFGEVMFEEWWRPQKQESMTATNSGSH
jgi:hypothetical protein